VKLDNVLLKSDPLAPLGFAPKVRAAACTTLTPAPASRACCRRAWGCACSCAHAALSETRCFQPPTTPPPQLADFGLTRIIRDSEAVINHSGAGTVTHLAPELFVAGSRLTDRVDSYAFGITMWEMYTGRRPYAGLAREAIGGFVARGGRPAFPPGTPEEYARLAAECWAATPAERPPMSEVVMRLRRMSEGSLAPPTAPGAAATAAAAAP
jgi:hypothetical protein